MPLPSDAPELYLDLMKKCLTRYIFPEAYTPVRRPPLTWKHLPWILYPPVAAVFKSRGLVLFRKAKVDLTQRAEGRDWPADAETMNESLPEALPGRLPGPSTGARAISGRAERSGEI